MKPFDTLASDAISLPDDDVDTDIIYPARYLLITNRDGLGQHAFADRVAGGDTRICAASCAPILIAGRNFGCGSSREHAVWAIADLGVRAIFAPSFGEIFRSNCANNGIVAGVVTEEVAEKLHSAAEAGHGMEVDLIHCTIACRTGTFAFSIKAADREGLLNGWNETTRILALHEPQIAHFEQRQKVAESWLWATENEQETTKNVRHNTA